MKTTELCIQVNKKTVVKGNLCIPVNPRAMVIFSHGSGSGRFSPRNKFVAESLNKNSIVTLLVDLLIEEEDCHEETRFDIDLLTQRLIQVTAFATSLSDVKGLSVGYFGASTGAASAIRAAAELDKTIHAVVSRGGRPDLAKDALSKLTAPALLIVGSLDDSVLELNHKAMISMDCKKELRVINGAAHLFEEPGKLQEVARLAGEWFSKYLAPNPISI